jgi:hypothetical protein
MHKEGKNLRFLCLSSYRCCLSRLGIFLVVILFVCTSIHSQERSSASAPVPALVDVIVTDKHANAPAQGLTRDDFQVFDGRTPIAISSFAHAPDLPPRPLVVWFVAQCPLEGIASSWVSNGSGFMKGKTASFAPVLQKLQANDTVGVAHWCDDGTFGVDLLPTRDRGAPSASIQTVLSAPMVRPTTVSGMDALHAMVLRVRDTSRRATPGSLPVLIFLYGDHGGMYNDEANDMLDQLLGPLPLVYGINNGAVSVQKLQFHSQNWLYIVHFLSDKTGGLVLSTWRGTYDVELDRILTELQGRYQLGFIPPALDGKQHELRIKLSDNARNKLKSADLRYASAFLASPSALASASSSESQAEAALALAMSNTSPYTDIVFDASGRLPAPGQPAQFRFYVDPHCLSWTALENGERHAVLTLAIGSYTAQGTALSNQIKQFEALQTKTDQSIAAQKAVVLGVPFQVSSDAVRLRFVLRDAASGRLGSFDLPTARINGFSVPSPATPPSPE